MKLELRNFDVQPLTVHAPNETEDQSAVHICGTTFTLTMNTNGALQLARDIEALVKKRIEATE